MLLDQELTIRRLLVACLDQPETIEPALRVLRRSLPETQITVLNLVHEQPSAVLLPTLQQGFDAAIVFTADRQSPYPIAYLCYLAGIPIRIGQSLEFGGGVLSHAVKPSEATGGDRHLYLLQAVGFPAVDAEEAKPVSIHS